MLRECSVAGCDRPSKTRGMCGAHAERVRSGAPLAPPVGQLVPRRSKPFTELYAVNSDTGCWEWLGAISTTGYGRYQREYTHRYSYELYVAPIPPGMQIDHLCRNRACCNPEHLEVVTPQVNHNRGMSPSAIAHRQGTCQQGHYLTVSNTYSHGDRARECKTCRRRGAEGHCPACGQHFKWLQHHISTRHPEAA